MLTESVNFEVKRMFSDSLQIDPTANRYGSRYHLTNHFIIVIASAPIPEILIMSSLIINYKNSLQETISL